MISSHEADKKMILAIQDFLDANYDCGCSQLDERCPRHGFEASHIYTSVVRPLLVSTADRIKGFL